MHRFKPFASGAGLFAVLVVLVPVLSERKARAQAGEGAPRAMASRGEFFRLNKDGSVEEVAAPFGFVAGADAIAVRPKTVAGWVIIDADGQEVGELFAEDYRGLSNPTRLNVVVAPGARAFVRVSSGQLEPFFSLSFGSTDCSGDGLRGGGGGEPLMNAYVGGDGHVWVPYLLGIDEGEVVVTHSSLDWVYGCIRRDGGSTTVSSRWRRGPAVPMVFRTPISIQPRP